MAVQGSGHRVSWLSSHSICPDWRLTLFSLLTIEANSRISANKKILLGPTKSIFFLNEPWEICVVTTWSPTVPCLTNFDISAGFEVTSHRQHSQVMESRCVSCLLLNIHISPFKSFDIFVFNIWNGNKIQLHLPTHILSFMNWNWVLFGRLVFCWRSLSSFQIPHLLPVVVLPWNVTKWSM